MRFSEITEAVGRITKQNQTHDVGPNEIKTQAAKFGNTVDKDGRPPSLSKKIKGAKTRKNEDIDLPTKIDLDNALSQLDQRLQDIVIMRVKHDMTFKEIGKEIGTSIDRARQLFLKALRILRHPSKGVVTDKENEKIGRRNEIEYLKMIDKRYQNKLARQNNLKNK